MRLDETFARATAPSAAPAETNLSQPIAFASPTLRAQRNPEEIAG